MAPSAPRRSAIIAVLAVPMLREGERSARSSSRDRKPGRFSDSQVALLKTFADQAAIAIENVRLFNETKEALEQQTAISEILRVISGSPRDVRPVLDAVAERALRLCDASECAIILVEGDALRFAARPRRRWRRHAMGERVAATPRVLVIGRATLDRRTIRHADIVPLLDTEYPGARATQRDVRLPHHAGVPLMREDVRSA